MKNKVAISFLIAVVVFLTFSCVTPSPLYGTWYTSEGDQLIMAKDGKFSSTIKNGADSETLLGTWSTNLNVITFQIDGGGVRNSQYEINGGRLILVWTHDSSGAGDYLIFYRDTVEANL